MSALDGFLSTWDKARDTFGSGVPQTGEQFDQSAQFESLQSTVQTAAPGPNWTGTAADAYGAVNTEHARVLGELAKLDRRLAAHVNESANVVATGRQNLDNLRQWVVDAAASVPPGKNRDQLLMPIVQRGLSELTGIVTSSNDELARVAGDITKLGPEWDALKDQKMGGTGEGEAEDDDIQLVSNEEEMTDGEGDPTPDEIEGLVQDALAGDQQAAAKVDDILDTIQPEQLQPQQTDPNNPGVTIPPKPLSPQQAEVISQMQRQMSPMSLDALVDTKKKLGDHGDIIGDSMQVMSDPDVKFPLAVEDAFEGQAPPGIDISAINGSQGALPQSVQDALSGAPVVREITDPNQTVPVTTYPTGDDLKKVAELVQSGDQSLQQGSELDSSLMNRAVDVLHGVDQENVDRGLWRNEEGDSIVQDIFNSAGRDTVVSHDLITAPDSDFLNTVARHDWADDGQSVRTLTDWINDGSKSPDLATQIRAGETANSLSQFLSNHGDELLKINHTTGPFSQSDTTVGQMNPDLVQGWADALDPYQKAMLGDGSMPGFHPVEGVANSNYDEMRNIFAAIDSDPDAAKAFNAKAFEHILDYQKTHDYNDLANAGALLGVVDSAAVQEATAHGKNDFNAQTDAYEWKKAALGLAMEHHFGKLPAGGGLMQDLVTKSLIGEVPTLTSADSNVQTRAVADVMNQTNYQIAQGLVGNDQNLGEMQQYMNGTRLMTPDEYAAKHPDNMRNYYLDTGEYVGNRGYDNAMMALYIEYQNAGGINMPRPPGE